MPALQECDEMAKKKSEVRKHTAMVRMEAVVQQRAGVAAKILGVSLADFVTEAVRKEADRVLAKEGKRFMAGD